MFDDIKDVFAGSFIKGEEFEKGLTLKVTKKPELVAASNPKYGFDKEHEYAGKTIRYHFELNGDEKTYDSTSARFKSALEKAGVTVGDTVKITRTGKDFDTHFTAEKIGAPDAAPFN